MKNYSVTIEFEADSYKEAEKIKKEISHALWKSFPWAGKILTINPPECD